ncbi:MAG: ABC transporter substrate-binding protein [Candidatus Hydrogenedens sp.]|jgi:ribose transport system substrate-binding protein|nr:ABC transporter substrate-binding protein [Candidatus Hydrogenedens sp.]
MRYSVSLFVLLSVLCLAGCGGDGVTKKADSGALEIAVIPKGLSHQFWLGVKAGAEAAAAECGASVVWQGPPKETEIALQINIVQDMITRGVSAIVMAACDENALATVIDQADKAGIPVVMVDSGVKSDIPKCLVATDNLEGAKMAAEVLAGLMDGQGELGLLPFISGAATSEIREQGFKEGVAAYPEMKIVTTHYTQSDVSTAMNVTSDMLTAHPDLGGIFATNEPGAIGAAQALRAAGKAGKVKLVGFDSTEEEINALKEGVIQALIVQDPFKMGYEGVNTAVAALQGETVPSLIDTGVTVVTLENLESEEVQALLNAGK